MGSIRNSCNVSHTSDNQYNLYNAAESNLLEGPHIQNSLFPWKRDFLLSTSKTDVINLSALKLSKQTCHMLLHAGDLLNVTDFGSSLFTQSGIFPAETLIVFL